MTSPRHRAARATALCVLVALLAPASSPAQMADRAARAAEADIKLILKDAVRAADAEPAKGAVKLRQLLTRIESDRALPADRRDQLARVVKDRLKLAESGGADAAAVAATAARQTARDAEFEKHTADTARLKSGLQEALRLDRQGKSAEAQAKTDELFREFKDHAIVQAVAQAEETAKMQAAFAETRTLKQKATTSALNSVDRAAVPPGEADVTYPKDWKEKTAARKADTAPTAEELKLLKALNSTINADFKESKLQDVVDYISTMIGLPVVLDKGALDENRLAYDTPVTFAVKKPISARAALRGILPSLGLTFVVTDGVVFVTTPTRAREFMTVKTYNITDLVQVGFEDSDWRKRTLNALMLMEMITSMVDPESWERRGGAGIIRYYDPKRALVIRQSAEVHAAIKGSLR